VAPLWEGGLSEGGLSEGGLSEGCGGGNTTAGRGSEEIVH